MRRAREEIESSIQTVEKSWSEASSMRDPERLNLLVTRLDQGDPIAAVENLATELVTSQQELDALRKRLGVSIDWERVAEWPIPPVEKLRGFDELFTKEETLRRDLDRDLKTARAKLRNAEVALSAAELEGVVPLPADWEVAKELRNATWMTIQGVWLDGQTADKSHNELAARFGDEIKEADELADQLRRDAERVMRKAQALMDRDEAQKTINDLEGQKEASNVRIEETKSAWKVLWKSFGIVPDSPKAMIEWRVSWESLVKAATAHRALLSRRETATRRRDQFLDDARVELGCELTPVNVVAMIRRRHTEANTSQGRREQIEKNLESLRDSEPKKKKLEDEANLKRQSWQEQWVRTVDRLPAAVRADLEPAFAPDLIEGIDKFRGRIDFRKGRQGEVDKASKALEEWDALFDEVAFQLGESVAGDNPTVRVPGWKTRLETARETERKRESLSGQLLETRNKLHEVEKELAGLEERLRTLQIEAGAQSFDTIPEILRQVVEKETLELRLEQDCASPLRELAGDITLDELAVLVRARDGQDLAGLIQAANDTITSAESERDKAVNSAAEANAELDQLLRKQGGFESRADMESALARMQSLLPDYVVAVLAEKILDRAVERYRERNQGELFGSAASYFRCLTSGSFEDLIPDEDDKGEPILVGLRATGRVFVDGMSEGTCDQLYLALRLAHLEKHMRDHGPFPVILDDILVAFDDTRALAALECLVELAAKTQVLLFTHHTHVCELARHSPCRDRISILEMPTRDTTVSTTA